MSLNASTATADRRRATAGAARPPSRRAALGADHERRLVADRAHLLDLAVGLHEAEAPRRTPRDSSSSTPAAAVGIPGRRRAPRAPAAAAVPTPRRRNSGSTRGAIGPRARPDRNGRPCRTRRRRRRSRPAAARDRGAPSPAAPPRWSTAGRAGPPAAPGATVRDRRRIQPRGPSTRTHANSARKSLTADRDGYPAARYALPASVGSRAGAVGPVPSRPPTWAARTRHSARRRTVPPAWPWSVDERGLLRGSGNWRRPAKLIRAYSVSQIGSWYRSCTACR